jgi:hypothetical protein
LSSELIDVLESDADKDCWLFDLQAVAPSEDANAVMLEFFEAYRKFRILDQIDYANMKLSEGEAFLPLRRQARLFSNISLLCILGVFGIHIWIAGESALQSGAHAGPALHVAILWLAIVALAIRALEEGLQPEREIERYRHYAAGVKAIRDRFNDATSPAQTLEIMMDMERLSYDEMKIFLRSNNEARFVL